MYTPGEDSTGRPVTCDTHTWFCAITDTAEHTKPINGTNTDHIVQPAET